MTENQKLREVLQAISHIDDTTNHSVDASAALDRIGQIARQALALPTAEQVDDINVAESFTSVTKTAAPVGELPELSEPELLFEDGKDQWGYTDYAHAYSADQVRAHGIDAAMRKVKP